MSDVTAVSRRAFMRFVAGSPLLPLFGFAACAPGEPSATARRPVSPDLSDLIASPGDALNVFDFRRVAEQVLPAAHY